MRCFAGRGRLGPAAVLVCLVLGALAASPASAARNLITGFADPVFRSSGADIRAASLASAVDERAGVIRMDVIWRNIVGPVQPANPSDPADPAYDFDVLDQAVRDAQASGFEVLFTVLSAPDWAEGPHRPPVAFEVPQGTWKPDPAELGAFGKALAIRYSGKFSTAAGDVLGKVNRFEVWNEPNLFAYLTPQYDGKKLVVVEQYRRMLNAFYAAVKAVRPDASVIVGGNAPYGDPPGGLRTRPLLFLKQLLCLTDKLEPKSCPEPAKFDILGVHPINLSGGPTRSAIDDDDASSADVPNAVKILRAAEKARTIGGGHHDVWATEFWWESFPDGGAKAIPGLKKHGIWIEQALYLFWKAGVKVALNLQLNDTPAPDEQTLHTTLQSGVFLADGTPKPAATSFRFPFVLDRSAKDKVFAWGKSPAAGKLAIEEKKGSGWSKVDTVNVKAGKVFTATLKVRGKGKYRAGVGGETSLVWSLK